MISRRECVTGIALAGCACALGDTSSLFAAEPAPETASLRLLEIPALCWAPQYVAEELLRAEGFADVRYVKSDIGHGMFQPLASGEVHVSMGIASSLLAQMDRGSPIVVLGGVHVGCYELFGTEKVRGIRDLKGKTVGVQGHGGGAHIMLATMLAYVGVDPNKDVNWVAQPFSESMRLLSAGKIDAYMAFPPEPQELRAKKIGRVIVNTTIDKPWSNYFCCMVAGNAEFVRRNPIATKRALRAILKAANVCAAQPEQVAKLLVRRKLAERYDYTYEALKDLRYEKWRDYDPEDTLRFYALRMHEVGLIKSNAQKIVTQGTNWRFLNELKKELKV